MYYHEGGSRKGVYIWILLIVVAIIIFNVPGIRKISVFRATKSIINNAFFPVKYLGNTLYKASTSKVLGFIRIKGIQKENETLKFQLNENKARSILLEDLSSENQRLRAALNFKRKSVNLYLLAAEIIGRSATNWFETVEINRGSDDNVVMDNAVINDEGLIGRVCEVSKYSSKVLLITDPNSAVSVIDAETGDMGIANGNSMGPIRIKYMAATANVKVGDRIVTSAMSEIFPRGILVGTVRSVDKKDHDVFQRVEVSPAVRFSRLDKVFVIIR